MVTQSEKPVWLVAGCSTGFGRELVKQLLAKGYNVITVINTDKIQDLAKNIKIIA